MLKIAICDDERQYLERIVFLLQKNLQERGICGSVIEKYVSGTELLEDERLTEYDVVFLDINMPEMDGMQLAEEIRVRSEGVVLVFITAFVNYALEGYKVGAIRYLLKDALEELLPECVDAIIKKFAFQTHKMKCRIEEGQKELIIANICFVESKAHKLLFHMSDKTVVCYSMKERLDNIEAELLPYGFLRIHKSFLVNARYIKDITNYKVYLKNEETLPVPREKYHEVKQKYFEIMGDLL